MSKLLDDLKRIERLARHVHRMVENTRTTVMLNVEHGHHRAIWASMLTKKQVVEYWRNIEDIVPYWEDHSRFPGVVVDCTGLHMLDTDLSAALHMNDDSRLLVGDRYVYHKGYSADG